MQTRVLNSASPKFQKTTHSSNVYFRLYEKLEPQPSFKVSPCVQYTYFWSGKSQCQLRFGDETISQSFEKLKWPDSFGEFPQNRSFGEGRAHFQMLSQPPASAKRGVWTEGTISAQPKNAAEGTLVHLVFIRSTTFINYISLRSRSVLHTLQKY